MKDKCVEPVHQYKLGYPITHTISLQELEIWNFYCEEIIYVSDKAHVSNYPLTSERNMGTASEFPD